MPKIEYVSKKFKDEKLELIAKVNDIVDEYERQGYSLTLRQVYYQLVARDVIPNNERSYKNLGVLISDARLAGVIDWDSIVDRTRFLRQRAHWDDPEDILRSAAHSFSVDKWEDANSYCEVWVEKDALIDVVEQVCVTYDVNCLSCRGYVSQSTMWESARRLIDVDKDITIFHLEDHDPSGKDMSRDIEDRLKLFGANISFERIALNFDQIEYYRPPPNPTKLTDSRSTGYVDEFGYECWELDALEPRVITDLISNKIKPVMDEDLFELHQKREDLEKERLKRFASTYSDFAESEEFAN
ncbi:MAG: hypothetical protein LBE57_04735 [Methanosarcinales archaeon]|jgi:hypothetical protein|nr:hypothetical protein [Methanosarcinales archaeon]